ncbi:phosphomannomutase [Salinicola halophyticus]|uniref:phosphomannomutase n=1 Tax=Salinicola halophyticus TaxID=1808881 RepID=UPI003F48A9E1
MDENLSGIRFGTSGARGLVEDFSETACALLTDAFVTVMRQTHSFERIAIGMDLRPSSPDIARACQRAAESLNIHVEHHGVIPTPALALYSIDAGIPAIMVTGSHIPFDRNGIKFYRPEGEITKADEQAITDRLGLLSSSGKTPSFVSFLSVTDETPYNTSAASHYIQRYTSLSSVAPLKGWRIGVYQHSAAGRDINNSIFESLGATVISLGRSDEFVPIDTEAVSQHDQEQATSWVREHALDALFTTDGDGDRPLLADETGQWWRGDVLGLICARELGVEALAVPVSTNSAIEKSQSFEKIVRTRIGSPYVLSEIVNLTKSYSRVAGFEANGGFILGAEALLNRHVFSPLPTRDAVLPVITAMVAAANNHVPLSRLRLSLPNRFTASDRLQQFPTRTGEQLIDEWSRHPDESLRALDIIDNVVSVDRTDGLRMTLDNDDVIHLRPSGNAPELRCYAESFSEGRARELVANVLGFLNKSR